MNITLELFIQSVATVSTAVAFVCAQAEETQKAGTSIAETKAIAEQGFIYGLPIVMNYGVMYAY